MRRARSVGVASGSPLGAEERGARGRDGIDADGAAARPGRGFARRDADADRAIAIAIASASASATATRTTTATAATTAIAIADGRCVHPGAPCRVLRYDGVRAGLRQRLSLIHISEP